MLTDFYNSLPSVPSAINLRKVMNKDPTIPQSTLLHPCETSLFSGWISK